MDTVCLEPGILTSDDGESEELGLWEKVAVEDVVKRTELDEVGLLGVINGCDVSVETDAEDTDVLD